MPTDYRELLTKDLLDARRESYYQKFEAYRLLSPLQKHVLAFARFDKGDIVHDTFTVAKGLCRFGDKHPYLTGFAVHSFNAGLVMANPLRPARFSRPGQTDFGHNLHLGTNRIYKPDGGFDEGAWQNFVGEHRHISKSYLSRVLEKNNEKFEQESDTGRNTNNCCASKIGQELGGRAAWLKVFDRLATDWQKVSENSDELEPVIDAELLRLFFEDTLLCLDLQEETDLPMPKPDPDIWQPSYSCVR